MPAKCAHGRDFVSRRRIIKRANASTNQLFKFVRKLIGVRQSTGRRFMTRTNVGDNLRWGITRGVLFGAVFSVVLGLAILIRGSAAYGGATFPRIAAVTTILGFLGGLCVGSLRPFTRSSWGAVAVGSVGGVFGFAAIWIAAFGTDRSLSLPFLLGGALVGARASMMSHKPGQGSAGYSD